MTDEKAKIEDEIRSYLTEIGMRKMRRLLELRLEKHKDTLMREEGPTTRGRGQECQDLLKLFTVT